ISILFPQDDLKPRLIECAGINFLLILFLCTFLFSCSRKDLPNQAMIDLLKTTERKFNSPENIFLPEAMLKFSDSVINSSPTKDALIKALGNKGNALLQLGEEQKAIDIFQQQLEHIPMSSLEQRQ